MKFVMFVKQGLEQVTEVKGIIDVPNESLTLADMERVPAVEAFLERLFGLRFHINELAKRKGPVSAKDRVQD